MQLKIAFKIVCGYIGKGKERIIDFLSIFRQNNLSMWAGGLIVWVNPHLEKISEG